MFDLFCFQYEAGRCGAFYKQHSQFAEIGICTHAVSPFVNTMLVIYLVIMHFLNAEDESSGFVPILFVKLVTENIICTQ